MAVCRQLLTEHFYPRPPRGGRPTSMLFAAAFFLFLSTPSARRATVGGAGRKPSKDISIHALREEGDLIAPGVVSPGVLFLSTPSARRATLQTAAGRQVNAISIHALREEGDGIGQTILKQYEISIHALREEGDSKNRDKISIFKQIIQHSARI